MPLDIRRIQSALAAEHLDGWLLYDFRGTNTEIEQTPDGIMLRSADKEHGAAARKVRRERRGKRNGSLRALDPQAVAQLIVLDSITVDRNHAGSASDEALPAVRILHVSATTGHGIDALVEAIGRVLSDDDAPRDQPAMTNLRHVTLLERARESLDRARHSLAGGVSEEFPLLDLQEASGALHEVTGQRTSDDLLQHIFSRFCIGK